MARVLIAWELGDAFGHLARCLRLAEGLAARGRGVTLALKAARAFRDRHADFSPSQAIEQGLSRIERAFLDGWNTGRTRKTQEPQESPPACLH